MKKKIALALLVLILGLAMTAVFYVQRQRAMTAAFRERLAEADRLSETKSQMLQQLNTDETTPRKLPLPAPPFEKAVPVQTPRPTPLTPRAAGRKKREGLPMGVVLWDRVSVYDSARAGKPIFQMDTGDVVRVFSDADADYWHVQPGVDLYLARTTKEIRPAGERLPDRDGWVRKSDLHVFDPEDAKTFILELDPMTLGNDTSFSTLSFYERAMKNPDPVVHRVIGPRLIALVLLHEDYSSSWKTLYRDADPKIRDAALAALNERGVANSRPIIEDLIVRLTELTKTTARGETELEVLSILNVLKNSHHPRVPAALASFKDAWQDTQSADINAALNEILQQSPATK